MTEGSDHGWGYVQNSDLIRKVFGYFPVFHDAHVLSICMEHGKRKKEAVDVIIELHHWGQDDPNWASRGIDCIIALSFFDIRSTNISMNDFVLDNWVCEIGISKNENGMLVFDLEPNSGVEIHLECESAEVTRIQPFHPPE